MAKFPKLPKTATNLLVVVVIAAIVAGGVAFFLLRQDSAHKLTAQFTSGVGVYPGTKVQILGIEVGQVTAVKPDGPVVDVTMEYDSKYKLPSDAISVIVANSLVSDRFIQLAPAYSGSGPTLPDNATLDSKRTASPAELDDIYSALNRLSVALGPKGANKTGALNALVTVAANNLNGNGTALGDSISKLAAAARTLAAGKSDLFGTVKNLQLFTKALVDSDGAVRHFNTELATVAEQLAAERADLGTALRDLGVTLNDVATFVHTNAGKIKTAFAGLKTFTGELVKQQGSLTETLALAPVALANLVHSYQPNIGALGTRSNLDSITDPAAICALLDPSLIPGVPASITSPLGGVTSTLKATCASILSKISTTGLLGLLGLPSGLSGATLGKAVQGLVGTLTGGTGGTGAGSGGGGSLPGLPGLPGIITGGAG